MTWDSAGKAHVLPRPETRWGAKDEGLSKEALLRAEKTGSWRAYLEASVLFSARLSPALPVYMKLWVLPVCLLKFTLVNLTCALENFCA